MAKIKSLTNSVLDSKNVQVHSDGKRVRPASHRTVVILRGIPESTPVEEIKVSHVAFHYEHLAVFSFCRK